MKRQFVKDLTVKTMVSDIFYVAGREVKDRRDHGHFVKLELTDKTGTINAVVWDNVTELLESAKPGQFVRVNGSVGEYNGKLQMTVAHVTPVLEKEISRDDFIAASKYPIDQMYAELVAAFDLVTDPHLRQLLDLVFSDADFVKRFQEAPGGARVHHAYLGGLLEHTLFMLRIAAPLKTVYPEINYPLLVAGIILHDAGKIDEYQYTNAIDHTWDGRLLGHVVMGYQRIDAAIRKLPDFPEELARMILHMILSHHGEMAFGAPKTPKFVEAYLVYMLDNMDARAAMFREAVNRNQDVKWTEYQQYLQTNVYIPSRTNSESNPSG
jgi:3'-5' exoribonuclease